MFPEEAQNGESARNIEMKNEITSPIMSQPQPHVESNGYAAAHNEELEKPDGQPQIPSDFDKFIYDKKLVDVDDSKYLFALEQASAPSRELDVRSNDGHLFLKWHTFKRVSKFFFFGDDLLCLVNEPYITIIENVSRIPTCHYYNLLNDLNSSEVKKLSTTVGKNGTTIVETVVGCPTGPLLAFILSDSLVIHIVSYPTMSRIATLTGIPNSGCYKDLCFGSQEFLYALRGFPQNSVEIWNLRTLTEVCLIRSAFYTNDIILSPILKVRHVEYNLTDTSPNNAKLNYALDTLAIIELLLERRVSLLNQSMVIVDRGTQDVVLWTLINSTPNQLLAFSQAINTNWEKKTLTVVDAAFSCEGDIYLLTNTGDIYCVGEENAVIPCTLVGTTNFWSCVMENSPKDQLLSGAKRNRSLSNARKFRLIWYNDGFFLYNGSSSRLSRYKIISKTHFKMSETHLLDADALTAFNSGTTIFKANAPTRERALLATIDNKGMFISKASHFRFNPVNLVRGFAKDVAIWSRYAVVIEGQYLRFVTLHDNSVSAEIPLGFDAHSIAASSHHNIIAITSQQDGSLIIFKASERKVRLISNYHLSTKTLVHLVFSVEGNYLVAGSTEGHIHLLKVKGNGEFVPTLSKHLYESYSSIVFFHDAEGRTFIVALISDNSEFSTISFHDTDTLALVSQIELPMKLFQLSESRVPDKLFGVSNDGLQTVVITVTINGGRNDGLEKIETLKTYEHVCWRRMTSDWLWLTVYGTDGSVDVYLQDETCERRFSINRSLLTYNGYEKLAISPRLKFIVGIHISGVLTCRALRLRKKQEPNMECIKKGSPGVDCDQDEGNTFSQSSLDKIGSDADESTKTETIAIKWIHRQLISKMINIIKKVSQIEGSKTGLDQKFRDNATATFAAFVRQKQLFKLKYAHLVKINADKKEKLQKENQHKREVLHLYSKMYENFLEERKTNAGGTSRKIMYGPSMVMGIGESVHNFYTAIDSQFEDDTVNGLLLFCSDLVSVSAGFEKYISPRNLRNCGLYARAQEISNHRRKKGDDEVDRLKIDLTKKISEAVVEFSAYFLSRRGAQEEEIAEIGTKDDDDKSSESSLSLMRVGVSSKSSELVNRPAEKSSAVQSSGDKDVGQESSDLGRAELSDTDVDSDVEAIPDASDDSTEEQGISSESVSSESSFELPADDSVCRPGARSSYLVNLLDKKEMKRTRTFELKEGMLKYYYYLPKNAKGFLSKFRASSSHSFLSIFPLCLCPEEMGSPLVNRIQFLYSRYFIETLKMHFNKEFEKAKTTEEQPQISPSDELDIEDARNSNGEHLNTQLSETCTTGDTRFLIEPLMPLQKQIPLADINGLLNGKLEKIEICPAAWLGTKNFDAIKTWVEQAMISMCWKCKELSFREEDSLSSDSQVEQLPDLKTIRLEKLSPSTRRALDFVLSKLEINEVAESNEPSSKDVDDHTINPLDIFDWPELPENNERVTEAAYDNESKLDGSKLLKLLEEKGPELVSGKDSTHMLLFDYIKRRKWFVQSQVLSEMVQFRMQNYRSQMIVYFMDKRAETRAMDLEINAYLSVLSSKKAAIGDLFDELLQICNAMKVQLNELKQMKKILLHFCKKYNISGLQEHIDRMNDVDLLNLEDAGSIEYLEELVRKRNIFNEPLWNRTSPSKPTSSALYERSRLMGFIADFERIQRQIWSIFSFTNAQEVDAQKSEQEQTRSSTIVSSKEEIFQIATELYQIELTANISMRSIRMRLKTLYEGACYLKSQHQLYANYSQKLQLLENVLENGAKQWIRYEKMVTQFQNKDRFKFNLSRRLGAVSNLLPRDNVGSEIHLAVSKADKIFARLTKKHRPEHSKGKSNRSSVDVHGKTRESIDVALKRGILKEDEIAPHQKRRHSKVANVRSKKEADQADLSLKNVKFDKNKSYFDNTLDHFVKRLDENGGAELIERIRTSDLPKTLTDEQIELFRAGCVINSTRTKRRFYDNPVYTNVIHLTKLNRQFAKLENEYYTVLQSLITAKEDFRRYKAEITNMRTRTASLNEEVALIRQYIVSREETHIVTNYDKFEEKIRTTAVQNEIESEKMIAEVKRSIRLIKKGKFEAVGWLDETLNATKDGGQLSDEEHASKKSVPASEDLKLISLSEPSVSLIESKNGTSNDVTAEAALNEESEEGSEMGEPQMVLTQPKTSSLGEIIQRVIGLTGGTEFFSMCTTHCNNVPPFCCLEQHFNGILGKSNDLSGERETETAVCGEGSKIKPQDAETSAPGHLFQGDKGLVNILKTFQTQQQNPECEFPSLPDEKKSQDAMEESSQQSSYKMDPTFGSYSENEQDDLMDSGTGSSQDKQNSMVEKILENKPEIINQLTSRYIMDKCGELFISGSQQKDDDTPDADDGFKWNNKIERELKEHQEDLTYLYAECHGEPSKNSEDDVKRRKHNIYEARLRSEMLKEIRDLKDKIKGKKRLIEDMRVELEKLRLRKYPTFDI